LVAAGLVATGLVCGGLAAAATTGLPAPEVHPVVFLPGAPGSFLSDPATGRVAWGVMEASLRPAADALDRLALPVGPRMGLDVLRDELVASGVMERVPVTVAGVRSELPLYGGLIAALAPVHQGKPDPSLVACFDYDWRLDVPANAARLHRFLMERRTRLRAERPDLFPPGTGLRFDVVAHSMGGLIVRYALRFGDLPLPDALAKPGRGWRDAAWCRKIVLLDPPNHGSLASLVRLQEGFRYSSLLPRVSPAVLGTMPALYQVLPGPAAGWVESTARPGTPLPVFEVQTWIENRWGLAGPAVEPEWSAWHPRLEPAARRALAIRHLDRCLRRAADLYQALDASGPPPPGVEFHLLTGGGAATPVRATTDPASGRIRVTGRGSGDTVVAVASALWLPGPDGSPAADPGHWASVFIDREHHMTGLLDPAWSNRIRRILGGSSGRLPNETRWLQRVAPRHQGPR
jgi:hypothetical protein